MAKTTNCVFCGKELKSGLFRGDDYALTIGDGYVTCCEECLDTYSDDAKRHKKRLIVKLENLKRASKRKKISEKELAEMYMVYRKEEETQMEKCGAQIPTDILGCFVYGDRGGFAVKEQKTGFANSDITAKDMVKTLDKADEYDCFFFDKEDITKLEYRPAGSGSGLTMFSAAFAYEIRLNDEKVLTYKPCIAKMAVVGTGLFKRKSADKNMYLFLNLFRKRIGSDLPIVKVKKFM